MNKDSEFGVKTEQKRYKYFAQHMHMHSCYQPGASMEGHIFHAANLGMNYIWFTDHDIRMGRRANQIYHFDFERDSLFFVDESGLPQGFKKIDEGGNDCTVELSTETCFQGTQSMKLSASSDHGEWKGGGVYFWSSHKRHCASLMAGIKLEIAAMLEEAKDSRVIFDITLSQRPPEHECAHLLYVVGTTEGMKLAPHTAIIPLPWKNGWEQYVLDLSHDVLQQNAMEHGVGGLDNAFDSISVRVETRNSSVSAYVDNLVIKVDKKSEAVRSVQKIVAREIGKRYGVTPFVGTEISAAGPHKNCFTTTVPIIPYDEYGYKVSHEEAIEWVNKHGGIFALNHPFEKYKGKLSEDSDKEECLREIAEEFIAHKAWGASLMEVGFPLGRNSFSLEMHLRLWDKLTEAGIFLTGYGSSDNHSNRGSWYDGNNFANWLGVEAEEKEPVSEAAFAEAMKKGRLYTGNPVALKGEICFETEGGLPMGSVLTADSFERQENIYFSCDQAKKGWKFRLIFNGKAVAEEIVDSEDYRFVYTMKPESRVNFVRAELYDEDGVCIMLTNPIYMVRNDLIKGIAVCNPVEIDRDYLLHTVDYAKKKGFNHLQIVGPIHDAVKGNVDGMTMYRKYSMFNGEKDSDYINHAMAVVNEACAKTAAYGIKTYMWHHELELPAEFGKVYPEVLNGCGDIEVTHPLVKDFLVNKVVDFFFAYPNIDGLILTLHETKIPLLKLKDQKLGKIERVKYVTQILFDTCKQLGKELIVRPFASLEDDYVMMAKAYEEISTEMLVMDKWTQFDWSLTMPHNAFYHKIKNNPLFVEGDIFGEFFGKGFLPLMLKDHIAGKFDYCQGFTPKGYVARIDRAGESSFDDVNEVNIHILNACLNQKDVDQEIDAFFKEKYPNAASEIRSLMEKTEDILKKIFYAKGYYFTELSLFPTLNHSKNHYYFEMMRGNGVIESDEWYIPRGWKRGPLESLLEDKRWAADETEKLLEHLTGLVNRIEQSEYNKLWIKFSNLNLVAKMWLKFTMILMDYAKFFETRDESYVSFMEKNIAELLEIDQYGGKLLGDQFYQRRVKEYFSPGGSIEKFAEEIRESFYLEKEAVENMEKETVVDYVVCGGAMEGHSLRKEVNFSDTMVRAGALCRIPGNKRGMEWSSINAHGWFGYELKVKPGENNEITVVLGSSDEQLEVKITLDEEQYLISEKLSEGKKELVLRYAADSDRDKVRIRFDKISAHTPCIYSIKVV